MIDNNALHWAAIPLRSIAASELGRYTNDYDLYERFAPSRG